MSDEFNDPGPSRPKLIYTNRGYEINIECVDNFDISYFDSEHIEASPQPVDDYESSESDVNLVDNAGNVQSTPIQSNTEVADVDVR